MHSEDLAEYSLKDVDPDIFSSNKDLMVYMIHGNTIYNWKQGMDENVDKLIETQSRRFTIIRNDEFIVRSDDKHKDKDPTFSMKKFKVKFSNHQI